MGNETQGEGATANVGNTSLGVRSAYPIVFAILVLVVPLLIWLVQRERKEFMEQALTTLTAMATQHRQEVAELRQLQRDIALALLRRLEHLSYNLDRAPAERLPPGVLPPGVDAELHKQLPPLKE